MYKNKKVCSLLIAVAMLVTLIPFNAIAVLAAELSGYETSDGRKIESISAVGTVDIIESTGGWWETGDQGTFYRYDIMSTKPTVTITFDNGDVQTITYDQYIEGNGYNIENSNYRLWFDSYQSYENQWQVGENTAYVYLQILDENDSQVVMDEDRDTAVEFKVNIIESPVESINVILDRTFIENTGGGYSSISYWDEATQTMIEDSFYDYGYINYANIDITFKPDSQYANLSGSYGWWDLQNLVSGYNPSTIDNQPNWNGAGTYTAAIEYMGCTSHDFNIVINPSPVVSITATMNQEIVEGTCGWLCSGEEEYYYYNYNHHATYTVEFLDGSGYESGTYTAGELNVLIPDTHIQQIDDQNTNHWGVGTNKGKVSYMGCESQEFDVVITENPIESITITTDEYLSDADCQYRYSAWEDRFVGYYNLDEAIIWNNLFDLQIEVEYSDGRENEIFTTNSTKDNYYGNSGHEFSLSYWQEAENWQFGQNEITAYFDGTETKFNIELRDEIDSVTVNSKNNEYIRGALFYYREDFDFYETVFQHHNDIETIEVTFTDGSVKEYSWSMGFADNVEPLLSNIFSYDENAMALMQLCDFSECGTQAYPIAAWGQLAYVDVEIVDTTISSMTATCNKKLIKDFSGYIDGETGEFVYEVPTDFFSDELSLKIEYKDGTKETYSKHSLSGTQDRLYPVTVTEREDDPICDWDVGTHKVDVTLKNFTTTMDVEVIDVPVESIELSCENNKLYENGGGYYEDDKFYYDMPQTDEIEVTLNYFDGTSFTCKLDELFDETGYDYIVASNQSEDNLWAIDDGEEHYFVISYLGVEGKLPVEIIETNVKSMTTTLNATMMKDVNVRPVSHFEYAPDGFMNEIIDGNKYNIPYYCLVSEVEFKDGTTGTYTYKELLELDPYLATYDDQGKDGVWWEAGEHTASLIFNGYESKYVITIYAKNPNKYPEIEMISKSDVDLGWEQSTLVDKPEGLWGTSTSFSFEDFSLYLVDYKAYVSLDDNKTFEEYDLESVLENNGAKLDDVEWPMSKLLNIDGTCYMLFSGTGFGADNESEMRVYLVEVVDWETEEFNVYSMPFAKTGFDYFEPTLAKKDDTFVYIVGTQLYTSKDLTTWTVHDNIDDLLMESDENQYNQTSVWVSDDTVFVLHNIYGEDCMNPICSEIFVTTDFVNYTCLSDEVDENLTSVLNRGKIGKYEAFLFCETENFRASDYMGYTYDYGFYVYIPETQSFEEINRSNIEMQLENGDVCAKTIVNTVVTNPGYYQSLEYGDFVLTLISDDGEIKAKYEIPYGIASEGSTDSLINDGQEQNGRKYAYFIKTMSTYNSETETVTSKLLVTDNYFKSYYVFDLPGSAGQVYLSNDKTKLVASGVVYDEETGDATSEIWTCDWNKIVEQFDNAVGFTNDEVTGVSVDTTDYNTMSADISLEVSELDESDLVGNVKPEGEFEIYDITLMEDGEEQQPEEGTKVKVTIDVPEGYNGEEMKIYRAEEDGTYTDMNATYDEETNTLVYYTEHFSKYLIAKGISSIIFGDVNGDGEVNAKDVTILERYVAKWDDVEIVDENSDLNSDGLINAKGVTILARYIAKWAEYISLPFKK